MSNITFSEIMKFYPGHNKSVYEDLKEDYLRGSLIPFVGAGLSAFCGYLGWSKVLEKLAEFIFENDIKSAIYKMIESGEFLQAAQEIYGNYPRMLIELRKIIDYDKIENCDPSDWYTSAAYALPYLFDKSIVMTTNFDRVLEEVYDRCHVKFGKVVSPHEADILTQIRQTNPHCLFKLHGDIGPETYDIDRLVFTQEQYDTAYKSEGPLMQELPLWFQNKRLLFLGCSLMKDKTIEVLQQVTEKNPGLDHYAILACKPDEIGQRSRELGELGISAIYYPDGRHEAVRVILERLLEETVYSKYEEMNRHVERHMPISKAEHRFMYDSGYIGFTGREQELEQLMDFCQNPKQISWWAVTGPGGMGKSRLVYEFTEARKKEGWEIVWLNQNQDIYPRLLDWMPPVEQCILVADDVQSYLQAIGEWISSISKKKRSEKLRILLLEREGKDLNSAKWAEMMQADAPYDDTIPSMCYCSDFLQLEPLSEEELKTMMTDFAVASGKALKDDGLMERLLKTLQKADGDLKRPIYALAIVDAWCDGEDPTRWDKEQILNELTKRELNFYYNRLRNLSSDRISKELRSEFENLLARSCIRGILPLNEIRDEEYQKLRSRANKLEMEFYELLRAMGVVHRVKVYKIIKIQSETEKPKREEKIIEAVLLDCPDLVKEHLVLRQAFDKGQMKLMLPDNWDNQPYQLRFIRRVLIDYPEKLEEKRQFLEVFFDGNPKHDYCASIYSDLLFVATVKLRKLGKQTLGRLEKLHDKYQSNDNIRLAYARSLFVLTVEQALEECEISVSKLATIYEQSNTNEKIAVEYAKGLVNLAAVQSVEECKESVNKLAALYEQYEANEEITVKYAKGLIKLMVKQPVEECKQNVNKLAALHERYQTNEKIAVAYAQGLCNQTVGQSMEDRRQIVTKIMTLYEQYITSEELAESYVKSLFNLTIEASIENCEVSAEQMATLHTRFQDNEEIAITYANSLVNYAFAQDSEEKVRGILQKSKALLEEYPRNTEIQLSYAQTWFNLTLVQSLDALRQTVQELNEFLQKHPEVSGRFQIALDKYLAEHPDHAERYSSFILKT
ncbi:MAG: SIR2 family protein [Lachnospiraceae bacterium]|nr:SIR2 family protein [Lachnospiraceae bacterium]